jgi:RpiR family carbohydrate utilization transcriptional regulator
MTALTAEIDRIANATSWAGQVLLDGASPNAAQTTQTGNAALSKNDVVVAISQSGTTSALIDSVKIVRKAGVKVIGIMPGNTPLAAICDFPITINVGDNYRITKPHTSRIAYTAVIDVITMGVAQLKPEAQDHLYNIVDSQRSLKVD